MQRHTCKTILSFSQWTSNMYYEYVIFCTFILIFHVFLVAVKKSSDTKFKIHKLFKLSACSSQMLYNFFSFTFSSDNQAIRHCHCTDTRSPTTPHHADHGLCAAALPEAGQHCEDRPGEELQYAFLAGVPKTHDGWKLPGQPAGTQANITFSSRDLKAPCPKWREEHS